jgi:hypothetical protein
VFSLISKMKAQGRGESSGTLPCVDLIEAGIYHNHVTRQHDKLFGK